MYRCEECGFDYAIDEAAAVGPRIVSGCDEFAATLKDGTADLRARRQPAVWSPLEYGCHLRDVLLVQRERVLAARRTDRPAFDPMGREERVEHDGYSEQDPLDVARQLTDAARLFTNVLGRLGAGEWQRRVMYTYPEPFERSLGWVAVHTLHEVHHHLLDLRRQVS